MLDQLQQLRNEFLLTPYSGNEWFMEDYSHNFTTMIFDKISNAKVTHLHPMFWHNMTVYPAVVNWIENDNINVITMYFITIYNNLEVVGCVILFGDFEYMEMMKLVR